MQQILASQGEVTQKLDIERDLPTTGRDFLRAKVLSRGFSEDSMTVFREFYGRDPEVGPLLEARGLSSK